MTAANRTNIPGCGAETHLYTRYYLGDQVTAAGSVVDTAPTRPLKPNGTYPLTWFNSTTNQWVNEKSLDESLALGQQSANPHAGADLAGPLRGPPVPTLGAGPLRSVNNVVSRGFRMG